MKTDERGEHLKCGFCLLCYLWRDNKTLTQLVPKYLTESVQILSLYFTANYKAPSFAIFRLFGSDIALRLHRIGLQAELSLL